MKSDNFYKVCQESRDFSHERFKSLFRYYGILCFVAAIVLVGGDKIINMFHKSKNKETEEEE